MNGFLIGILTGAAATATLGAFLRWARRRRGGAPSSEQAARATAALFRVADGCAGDVHAYRQMIQGVSQQLSAARRGQAALERDSAAALLQQVAAANEQLQSRLLAAEEALTQQAEDLAAYACEARTDPLTGLPNRRSFDEMLQDALAEVDPLCPELAVILVDIDRFKGINDTHGHPVGDQVLREIARVIANAAGADALTARLGGEEFVVLLRDDAAATAPAAAERVRAAVAEHPLATEAGPLPVTVSCGVAGFRPTEEPCELLRRADEALYEAKRAGRNRVRTAEALARREGSGSFGAGRSSGAFDLAAICADLKRRWREGGEEAWAGRDEG